MKPRLIKPEPLTAAAFSPYGDVIEFSGRAVQKTINYGNTLKFCDVAKLDITAEKGQPMVNLFRSSPLPRPVQVKVMERHPLSSQAFYPLSHHPYLVVVAEKGDLDPKKIRVFLAGPEQGVNYHAGTWHHYSLALDKVSDFMVIDRSGPEKNCDEMTLNEGDSVLIDY